MVKLVYGVGSRGSEHPVKDGYRVPSYSTWMDMLKRCYSDSHNKKYPTYSECFVCDDWLYYPTFKLWFDSKYIKGFQLDKDILYTGNKEYSPRTCSFVPQAINSLFLQCGSEKPGCCFCKANKKYMSQIRIDKQRIYLGYYATEEEAHNVWVNAKKDNIVRIANIWKDKINNDIYNALLRKASELV